MFRGSIKKKGKVTATLSADFSNAGAAAMVTTNGPEGAPATSQSVVVSPGGTNQSEMTLGPDGLYRIFVDVKQESDGGRLTVLVNGKARDEDTIKGDTTWLYSIE